VEALVLSLPRSEVFNHYRSSDPILYILHTYTVFAHKPYEIPSIDSWMKTLDLDDAVLSLI